MNATADLTELIGQYRIGRTIRDLRGGKRMSQADLASHTGLSPATISKIERGDLVPTLQNLMRIGLVFGLGLEYFFQEPAGEPAVRHVQKSDRITFPEKLGKPNPSFFFESLDFPALSRTTESYHVVFPAGAARTEDHDHAGAEFIYVVSGTLALKVGPDSHHIAPGDSVHFDSSLPHSYAPEGSAPCEALVVVVPAQGVVFEERA